MKILSWIVTLPVALVAVTFAVANRAPVTVDLWPLPFSQDLPLYVLVLGSLVVGVLFGSLVSWLRAGKARQTARAKTREAKRLSQDADLLQQKIEQMKNQPPALPAPDNRADAA